MAPPVEPPAKPDPPGLDDLRGQLRAAAALGDPTERLLEVAATWRDSKPWASPRRVKTGGCQDMTSPSRLLVRCLSRVTKPNGQSWQAAGELRCCRSRTCCCGGYASGLHWHHASGFHQAAHLLLAEELDGYRLEQRAEAEGLAPALQALRALTVEIEGGRVVEEWEIAELGREVERQSYSPNGDD